MKNLKTTVSIVALAVLIMLGFSCEKDEEGIDETNMVEVTFEIDQFIPTSKDEDKRVSGNDPDILECSDLEAAYVIADISGTSYTLKLITLGQQTEVIKLTAGDYMLNSFVVWADNDTPDNLDDDTAIYASPAKGSYYDELWSLNGVARDFIVPAFDKIKISVKVICYQPYRYDEFGFAWFEYAKYTIKSVCFYGDIGTKFYEEFHAEGSPYENQPYVGYDFPAIFSVKITDGNGNVNDLTLNSNEEWLGIGAPLCIEYLDLLGNDDTYNVELSVFMPDGTSPVIHSFSFDDSNWVAETATSLGYNNIGGVDGIYDFTVGNFSYDGNDANLELPPYMPVPTSGKMSLTAANTSYVDIKFSNMVDPTAEIFNGAVLNGWCAAEYDHIYLGTPYDVNFYSSLEVTTIPGQYKDINWGSLNWMMNNQTGTAAEIQEAIWQVVNYTDTDSNNPDAGNPVTASFALAALAQADFIPTVGDWAIIICDAVEANGNEDLQLLIVRMDP